MIFLFLLCSCLINCQGIGPVSKGDAAEELIHLVPGDRFQLDNGKIVSVDRHGKLQGIDNLNMVVANKKLRDVAYAISTVEYFESYKIVRLGKRFIDVGGAVKVPGRHTYPLEEDWTMMNLLLTLEGIYSATDSREYLLVRKYWEYPNTFLFIRGEAVPALGGIGGDDLFLCPGDKVLFPGNENLIYIFGAVQKTICFTYNVDDVPNLESAIQAADGFTEDADLNDIQVFRVLRGDYRTIFQLTYEHEKQFTLQGWDIIYVPFQDVTKNPRIMEKNTVEILPP
ncbi:MAG: hypothetical protein KBC30_07545 [Planctomycetes bacterium]|nr:hypothetical protein [Planctomycetota bacterium]HON45408.1 hypothetical protein [Planctomycetota bacterium]HPY74075.1 hypothetical protein [Planctomycetota bacterium]HQA99621.1 hypothetical protein [Planctomycetota bacterium]HRU52174.1 hypothetical protein [Planctomycetota bacterium]